MAIEAFPSMTAPLRVEPDGTVRVGKTRVTLDVLLGAYNLGKSPQTIVREYTTLELADVYAVIGYYLQNKAEVDEYLRVRAEEAEELRIKIEADPDNQAFRERVLARARARGLA